MNIVIKRKSLFGFKSIRFKFSSQPATELKHKDVVHIRTTKLAELLDCTSYTAREIISRNGNIISTSSSQFIQNAKFCGEFLKLSDVVEHPCLLTLNPSLLQHRYFSLQELGCSNISGKSILRYQQLVKKTPTELEREGLRFSLEKNLETCHRFLPPDRDDKEDFLERLHRMHQDGSSLCELKEATNAEVFAAKLDCSTAITHRMFRSYPPLRTQSTGNTLKVFDVLRERFRFPSTKICYSPTVLSMHHETVAQLLEQLPSLLGVETADLVRRLPILLRRPPHRLQQVEKVLRDKGVQAAQLLSCPKAATLCPRTLQARLESLLSSPAVLPFRPHRRFLWLAYYFSRLEPRLRALQAADAPCSIASFTVSDDRFAKCLMGELGHNSCSEALAYLSEASGVADVASHLPPSARPILPNCSHVVEFLRGAGVSRAQLAHGLDATLYGLEVVRRHWAELQARPDWAEWAAHYNVLQLLVYEMEVGSGFRHHAHCRPSSGLSDYAF